MLARVNSLISEYWIASCQQKAIYQFIQIFPRAVLCIAQTQDVRPSRSGIVPKRLNIPSKFFNACWVSSAEVNAVSRSDEIISRPSSVDRSIDRQVSINSPSRSNRPLTIVRLSTYMSRYRRHCLITRHAADLFMSIRLYGWISHAIQPALGNYLVGYRIRDF